MGNNVVTPPVGKIPIGTCQVINKAHNYPRMCLHAIGPFCERLDNKFLIMVPPLPHRRIGVRIDNSSDVVVDVLLLSILFVNRDRIRRYGLKRSSDVDLRSTRDTHVKIWKLEADKVLQEIEDLLAGGWNPRGIRAFIYRIQYDVDRTLVGQREHIFETCDHCFGVGFVCAIIVCLINMGEYVATTVGTSGELCKKGRKGIVEVLFIGVPEIEIEIGDGGLPCLLQRHYVLDDCRASWWC